MKLIQIICCSILFISASCVTLKTVQTEPKVLYVETDTLFNSQQKITILKLNKQFLKKHSIDLAYVNDSLKLQTLSTIGKNNNAIVAINGGFFNMDEGGSVTFLEKNDVTISTTKPETKKWSQPTNRVNGVVLLNTKNKLKIEKKSDEFYRNSNKEKFVLRAGPVLIYENKMEKLDSTNFSVKRHPRSAICTSKNHVILLAIDGRQDKADGMTLIELQHYMKSLGCTNAINLDGGGSTTVWLKNKGVINHLNGRSQRKIANAILIK